MRGLKIKLLLFCLSLLILTSIAYFSNKLTCPLFLKLTFYSIIIAYCFNIALSFYSKR